MGRRMGAGSGRGGSPKGLEVVGSVRVIDRVARALREVTSSVILSANDPDAVTWLPDVVIAPDLHRGAGGLAGIEAALSRGPDALVVAWDMPFVTAAVLRLIIDAALAHDADVAVPESESPHGFEPFCAYYRARSLPALSAFLANGGGPARDFVAALPRVYRVPLADVERLGDPRVLFFSVNTPDELARARAMAAATE